MALDINQWIGLQVIVEGSMDGFVSSQTTVEGVTQSWSRVARDVMLRGENYVSQSSQVEVFVGMWNQLLVDIVHKHRGNWVAQSKVVEQYNQQWVGSQSVIEQIINQWLHQSKIVESYENKYIRSDGQVEAYINNWVGSSKVVEQYQEQHVLSSKVVELMLRMWFGHQSTVEAHAGNWCGLLKMVKPKLLFNPVGGKYNDWVDVRITAELLPSNVRITLDGTQVNINSALYNNELIRIRRPKRLSASAWYPEGYVIHAVADYDVPIKGYVLATDGKEVVIIEDEVLWKK